MCASLLVSRTELAIEYKKLHFMVSVSTDRQEKRCCDLSADCKYVTNPSPS